MNERRVENEKEKGKEIEKERGGLRQRMGNQSYRESI